MSDKKILLPNDKISLNGFNILVQGIGGKG
jgi:hypothetical protein